MWLGWEIILSGLLHCVTERSYQRINLWQVQSPPSLTRKKGEVWELATTLPRFFDNRIATLQLVELTVSSVILPVGLRLLKFLNPGSQSKRHPRFTSEMQHWDCLLRIFPVYWYVKKRGTNFFGSFLCCIAVWWRKMFPSFPKTYCIYLPDKSHEIEQEKQTLLC
jgi:hypothetical protein